MNIRFLIRSYQIPYFEGFSVNFDVLYSKLISILSINIWVNLEIEIDILMNI